jgi:putative membrane protein
MTGAVARRRIAVGGGLLLAGLWLGPLPEMARSSFALHMVLHIGVVALAAPMLAFGIAGSRADPARAAPRLFAPLPASALELVIVWAWHTPLLHHLAREQTWGLVTEQASFLAAGLLVWSAALGGRSGQRQERAAAGIAGLLMTSMHMTLLGALLAVTPRPLFHHATAPAFGLTALEDQHLGGVLMLIGAGLPYLAGALALLAALLRPPAPELAGGIAPQSRREAP